MGNFPNNITDISSFTSLKVLPNPATSILDISTIGFDKNTSATISILSASGMVVKTVKVNAVQKTRLNVSSLASGVYVIKIVSGKKVVYKQFVKM